MIKQIKAAGFALLLAVAIIMPGFLTLAPNTAKAASANWGLHVESDGTITLDGQKFYGVGVNIFDAFNRTTASDFYEDYTPLIKALSKNKIPVIRVPMCGFYPNALKKYVEFPNVYFSEMDRFVNTCQKYNVGIIADLLWEHYAVSDVVGEPVSKIGDPNSKTIAYAKKYIKDVVTRYKDSPAIWGWEINNETNSAVDVGAKPPVVPSQGTPSVRGIDDIISTEMLITYYDTISTEIRKYDSYRMITTGDNEPRAAAYNLNRSGEWIQDTKDQLRQIFPIFTTKNVDTISVHHYDLVQDRFGSKTATLEELVEIEREISRNKRKAYYIGEFSLYSDQDTVRYMNMIKKNDIQLATAWTFQEEGSTVPAAFSEAGDRPFLFARIKEINEYYRNKNMQSTEGMWARAPKVSIGDSEHVLSSTPISSLEESSDSSETKSNESSNNDTSTSDATPSEDASSDIFTSSESTVSIKLDTKDKGYVVFDNGKKIAYVVPDLTQKDFMSYIKSDESYSYKVFDDKSTEITETAVILDGMTLKVFLENEEIGKYEIKIGEYDETPGENSFNLALIIIISAIGLFVIAAVVTFIILYKKGILKFGSQK